MRITLLVASLFVLPAVAGCLGFLDQASTDPAVTTEAWTFEVPVTMNVVLVGFDGRLDTDRLAADLPETRPVYNWIEFGTTRSVNLEPIQYRLDWRFHEAPDAFADGFFGAVEAASFDGPAPDFLIEYDHGRDDAVWAHDPASMAGYVLGDRPTVRYVDAPTVEQWVIDHRADFGLDFGGAQYTYFIIDSKTNGYLPDDEYHYYYFDDGTIDADLDRQANQAHDPVEDLMAPDHFHTPKDPTSNRGWGGASDFMWLDVGAAPSWLDWEPFVPPIADDNRDLPVWEADADRLHLQLNRHLRDWALVKVARVPIYDFEYQPKWLFPVHVFVQSTAVSGSQTPMYGVDVETWLGAERIEAAFEDLAPWVDTEVTIEYHYLPHDDMGMWQAVEQSKLYGNPTMASSGVISDHIRQNWDVYVPPVDDDTRVFPQFMFFLDGLYTFWGPNQGGGFADGDGWGRPWAAFNHIFDVCVKTDQAPCTKATKWEGEGSLDLLVIHEGGHHVGLTHARDMGILNEDGTDDEYQSNWFLDSTWSVMTYRHQNPGFDQYDRDAVARGHVGWVLNNVTQRMDELRAAGTHADAIAEAEAGIRGVEAILLEGRWQDAAYAAVATWDALVAAAGPIEAAAPATTVESFGDQPLVPVSPGAAGVLPTLPGSEPLRAYLVDVEVKEGAERVHLAFRDTRPTAGALRAAYLVLLSPDGEYAGSAFGDVFRDAHITGLQGPGTYQAVLVTNGGLASEYDLTLDVHYPTA